MHVCKIEVYKYENMQVCKYANMKVCKNARMLFATCYLWLAICYLLTKSFYLKLAITCRNFFLSLVVVRHVIFLYCNLLPTYYIAIKHISHIQMKKLKRKQALASYYSNIQQIQTFFCWKSGYQTKKSFCNSAFTMPRTR